MITLFLGPDECRAEYAGPYIGSRLQGSFITYVCDKPRGHAYPTRHFDSAMGFAWADAVAAPRLVTT
jgi:hypothetical protein